MKDDAGGVSAHERPVGRPAPERAKLTAPQKRMQKAIAYMQQYMADYHKQAACLDYSDATFIDDVLYGLGVALHGTSCSYASGYEAWKAKLREHLKPPNVAVERAAEGCPLEPLVRPLRTKGRE